MQRGNPTQHSATKRKDLVAIEQYTLEVTAAEDVKVDHSTELQQWAQGMPLTSAD